MVPHLARKKAKTLLPLNEKTGNFAVVAWMILWPLQKVSQSKLLSSYRISLKIWTLCWQACFVLWFPRKCLNTTIAASNDPTVSNLSLKRQLVYSVVIMDCPMAKLSQPKLLLNQTHKMSRNGSHSDCHPSGDGIWLSSLAHLCPKTEHTREQTGNLPNIPREQVKNPHAAICSNVWLLLQPCKTQLFNILYNPFGFF